MKRPETLRNRSSSRPSRTTIGSFRPKMPSSCSGISRNSAPIVAGDAEADARGDVHGVRAALGIAGAEVLPGDRGRRAHQPTDVQVISENSSV